MSTPSSSIFSVDTLISQARKLALEYRRATGKALPGISSEIALYDAARLLNLELPKEAQGGYDAIGRGAREGKRIQIKARVLFEDQRSGARIGQMKTDQEWDSVMLVVLNDEYDTIDIYEVERASIEAAMSDTVPSKRNKRGAMSVAKFKAIGQLVWTAEGT